MKSQGANFAGDAQLLHGARLFQKQGVQLFQPNASMARGIMIFTGVRVARHDIYDQIWLYIQYYIAI